MSRKPTPSPEGRFLGGGGIIVAIFCLPAVTLWLVSGKWWNLIFAFPLVFYVVYIFYGILLLIAARLRWRNSPIRGILVTSDSPKWQTYIEEQWMPRLGDKVVVLNWSERRQWRSGLAVRLFSYFGENSDNRNYNPVLILLRGLRYPLVYRFFYAFRDAKHGDRDALERLEGQMFGVFE